MGVPSAMGIAFRQASCVLGVVALMALAGCADSGSVKSQVGPQLSAPDAEFDETTGAIHGAVFDDEANPLSEATVLLVPGQVTAATAQDGTFSFSRVAPGRYTLFATKIGYNPGSLTVEVVAGQTADQSFQLGPVVISVPRKEVLGPIDGYIQCRMGTTLSSGACGFLPLVGDAGCLVGNCLLPTIWANDRNRLIFQVTGEDWQQIVFEAQWTASTAATNPKMNMIFSYSERIGTHWFANATPSLSPIKFTYTNGVKGPGGQFPAGHPESPNVNLTLWTWLTVPFGTVNVGQNNVSPVNVAFETRFKMMVTIFYSQNAPENYSGFES